MTELASNSLREDLDELLTRLGRLHAASVTLHQVADSLADNGRHSTLVSLLDDLERDLELASRDAGRVRAHAGG